MRRASVLITMLALISVSLGAWLVILLGMFAYGIEHRGHGMLPYPSFLNSNRDFMLAFPLPFIGWGLWLLRHDGPTADQVILYIAVALLTFSIVLFAVLIGVLMPWATIVDI
jgi:hypothetical protein